MLINLIKIYNLKIKNDFKNILILFLNNTKIVFIKLKEIQNIKKFENLYIVQTKSEK